MGSKKSTDLNFGTGGIFKIGRIVIVRDHNTGAEQYICPFVKKNVGSYNCFEQYIFPFVKKM